MCKHSLALHVFVCVRACLLCGELLCILSFPVNITCLTAWTNEQTAMKSESVYQKNHDVSQRAGWGKGAFLIVENERGRERARERERERESE